MRHVHGGNLRGRVRGGPFQAQVEFVPRESWDHEVSLLLGDLRDAQAVAAEPDGWIEPAQMSRAVREKLWTVYRPTEDSGSAGFDPFRLVEPAEITQALDAGFTDLGRARIWRSFKGQSRTASTRSTDFGRSSNPSQFAVHSRRCRRAKIVDLPGINDPERGPRGGDQESSQDVPLRLVGI